MDRFLNPKKGLLKQGFFYLAIAPCLMGGFFGIVHAYHKGILGEFDLGKSGWVYFYNEFDVFVWFSAVSIPLVSILAKALSSKQTAESIIGLESRFVREGLREDFVDFIGSYRVEVDGELCDVSNCAGSPLRVFNYLVLFCVSRKAAEEIVDDAERLLEDVGEWYKAEHKFCFLRGGWDELIEYAKSYQSLMETVSEIGRKCGGNGLEYNHHFSREFSPGVFIVNPYEFRDIRQASLDVHRARKDCIVKISVCFYYASEVVKSYDEDASIFLFRMYMVFRDICKYFNKSVLTIGSEDAEDRLSGWSDLNEKERSNALFWISLPEIEEASNGRRTLIRANMHDHRLKKCQEWCEKIKKLYL